MKHDMNDAKKGEVMTVPSIGDIYEKFEKDLMAIPVHLRNKCANALAEDASLQAKERGRDVNFTDLIPKVMTSIVRYEEKYKAKQGGH